MKQLERHPRTNCSDCGIRFVFGAMFEDWEERLDELGLTKVYGLYPTIENPDLSLELEDCDGVFMSDIVGEHLACPNCGASAMETVEVEYSDYCMQCGCTRDVREVSYFIGSGEGYLYNWVCEDCPEEPEPEPEVIQDFHKNHCRVLSPLGDRGMQSCLPKAFHYPAISFRVLVK